MNSSKNSEYVIYFLKELNDNFDIVKTQILLLDPLPQINRVFALVTQQERKITNLNATNSPSLSAANTNTSLQPLSKSNNYQGCGNTNSAYGEEVEVVVTINNAVFVVGFIIRRTLTITNMDFFPDT